MDKTRLLEINRRTANMYYSALVKGQDKTGLAYLSDRGITRQTIRDFGLGYAPDTWNFVTDTLLKQGFTKEELIEAGVTKESRSGKLYDMFRNRVMFPIIDLKGNVIGFGGRTFDEEKNPPKYLNTGETPVFDKGSNLFAMNIAKKSDADALILCEGYMDTIAMQQAGFTGAFATLGTALTSEQAHLISRFTDNVICAYDNDEAGTKAKIKAVELLSDAGVNVRVLNMEGVNAKDPDEFIKKNGGKAFQKLLDKAENAINFTLRTAKQTLDLTSDKGKAELSERISHPMKLLPNAQKALYSAFLSQNYGIITESSREQLHNDIIFKNDKAPPAPAPKAKSGVGMSFVSKVSKAERMQMLYDMPAMTDVSRLDLPDEIIEALEQGGITTVDELMSLSPEDMKVVLEDDSLVNQLCEYVGIDRNPHDNIDRE